MRLSILFSLVMLFEVATSLFAQKRNPTVQYELFKSAFPGNNIRLSNAIAQWNNEDSVCLNYGFHNGIYQREKPIDTLIDGILAKFKGHIKVANSDSVWTNKEIPNNIELLDKEKFASLASKNTKCNCPYKIDLSTISRPVFSKDSMYALLKVDYSLSKWASNTCQYHIIYLKRNDNKWKVFGYTEYNCMIE